MSAVRRAVSRPDVKRKMSVGVLSVALGGLWALPGGAAGPAAVPVSQPATATVAEITVTLGPRVTLLPDRALGLRYFPDMAIAVILGPPHLRLLLTAGFASYVVEGTNLQHLSAARQVLAPGPPGSFDNGDAAISGAVSVDGTLWAIYHAEDHEDLPPIPGNIPGYYASVGLATSTDGGDTWRKRGQIIVSPTSKAWTAHPGHNARGAGLPGLAPDPGGRYLYLYYTDQSFTAGRGTQICMARADLAQGPPLPGRWRKYWAGEFSEPGLGGRESPVLSVDALDEAHAMYPHPAYSAYLGKYIMVFNVNRWKEPVRGLPLTLSGIYFAVSDDGIQWSAPAMLVRDYSYPILGKSLSWEATIVWDGSEGREGWLVYGHSERWGHDSTRGIPHYMVGQRLKLARSDGRQGGGQGGSPPRVTN
jgi:hypothetical protein